MSACVARTAFPSPSPAPCAGASCLASVMSGPSPSSSLFHLYLPCAPGPPDERRRGALSLPEGEGPGLGRPALARRQLFDPVGKPLVALGVPQLAPRVGVAAAVLQAVVDGGPPLLRRVRLGGPAPLVERAPGLEPFPVPASRTRDGWPSSLIVVAALRPCLMQGSTALVLRSRVCTQSPQASSFGTDFRYHPRFCGHASYILQPERAACDHGVRSGPSLPRLLAEKARADPSNHVEVVPLDALLAVRDGPDALHDPALPRLPRAPRDVDVAVRLRKAPARS